MCLKFLSIGLIVVGTAVSIVSAIAKYDTDAVVKFTETQAKADNINLDEPIKLLKRAKPLGDPCLKIGVGTVILGGLLNIACR